MRSRNLVLATLAVLTDLGAVAAPINARGVNDANDNPSLQILTNKIPSKFRLEASALVMPSPEDAAEHQSQGGTGVEITRTGDEDTTLLRTHDVVPLGRGGGQRNSTALTRPLLAGAGGQASPFARAGGGAVPFAHPPASDGDEDGEAAPAQQQPGKRADGGPLAGIQDLPRQAIKMSNAPVPAEAMAAPGDAIKQAAAALPDSPSPAGAVAATQDIQEMPAQAMAAAGGMIPPAAAAASPRQRRGDTRVGLPAVAVSPATAQTDALGLQVFDEEERKRKRGNTSVRLPAFHVAPTTADTDALGLQVFEQGQEHQQPNHRALENTAEGCRRHAAELAGSRNNGNNDNASTVVQLRPVAQVDPVASVRPAADIKLPNGPGLVRTLGLQRRQVSLNLPRPRPDDIIPPIVVAPQVRPAVGLKRRTMRRGERTALE